MFEVGCGYGDFRFLAPLGMTGGIAIVLRVTGRGGFETRPYGVEIRGKGMKPLTTHCFLQLTINPEAGENGHSVT